MYTPTLNTKMNGVPILSRNDINNIGECLVADFYSEALKEPCPIDIDRFVSNYLNMKQDFQYLSHCGIFLGMMIFNDTKNVPVYNPESHEAEYINVEAGTMIIDNSLLQKNQEHRYRFTVGHEGAHYILHSSYFRTIRNNQLKSDNLPFMQCRIDNKRAAPKPLESWTDSDWMEWKANRLSSAILMPQSTVNTLMRSYSNLTYSPTNLVEKVSKAFNVSFDAAQYRLKDLGYINKYKKLSKVYHNYLDIFDD